jgi:regulator of protease activity HflC (stomatin/prohibitin superfamily)
MTTYITTIQPVPGFAFVIRDYETALLFKHGQFVGTLDPGRHRFWTGGYEVVRADTRTQMLTVQGQDLLTADQVTLKVSAVAAYRVTDALATRSTTNDPAGVMHLEVQLALRQVLAADTADAFLQKKADHGGKLTELLARRAPLYGLTVDHIDIRDVMLPADLKRSFMAALQQRQEANASLEKARAETAALRTLANAAKLMRDNPELLPLRYLQTLQELGSSMGNTFVLGLTDSDKLAAKALK